MAAIVKVERHVAEDTCVWELRMHEDYLEAEADVWESLTQETCVLVDLIDESSGRSVTFDGPYADVLIEQAHECALLENELVTLTRVATKFYEDIERMSTRDWWEEI